MWLRVSLYSQGCLLVRISDQLSLADLTPACKKEKGIQKEKKEGDILEKFMLTAYKRVMCLPATMGEVQLCLLYLTIKILVALSLWTKRMGTNEQLVVFVYMMALISLIPM